MKIHRTLHIVTKIRPHKEKNGGLGRKCMEKIKNIKSWNNKRQEKNIKMSIRFVNENEWAERRRNNMYNKKEKDG